MMFNSWLTLLIVALLSFWAVGARNRLVSMRNEISRCFGIVQTQIEQRQALLTLWLDSLHPLLGDQAPELSSVQAACQQVLGACEHARVKPASAQAATSLRMAEETLAAARQRLASSLPTGAGNASVNHPIPTESLATADNTLAFARHQFNTATLAYNEALMQFPTWVIAGLFGFRAAGTL